jgi:hypothetical protein
VSSLVVDDLDTTLTQKVTPTETLILGAIRPHILIFGNPAGCLRVDIYDSANTTLLKSSEDLMISDIKTQGNITESYFHGYIRFNIDWGLVKDTEYSIRLEGLAGYSPTVSDYIGWCRDFDTRKYTASYTPNEGFNSSFDIEFWQQDDNVRSV